MVLFSSMVLYSVGRLWGMIQYFIKSLYNAALYENESTTYTDTMKEEIWGKMVSARRIKQYLKERTWSTQMRYKVVSP